MCGICGILDLRLDPGASGEMARRLPAMIETLRHRGPNDAGQWCQGPAALGHTRLSIIDLSPDAHQPMANEDGSVRIVYNGEVYNFAELREGLLARGHRFASRSDTEVIVHLYEECGIDFVQRLEGMFALALWDARQQVLYLVRDRIGIKPLFYTRQGSRLIFGSEIKAILAHGEIPRAVCPESLSDYLTFLYVPNPRTMFRDIFKLPPGHWLRADAAGLRVQPYWDLPAGEAAPADRQALERDLRERMEHAVRREMVSDVPLGAFLSGGVDSSAVVAAMARAGQGPVITTSVGFEESTYNELPFAQSVARRYGTEHHEEIVRPEAASVIHRLAWHYDEPFADYSAIPTFYVSQAARRHVTVALSGDGGDENFAGYRRYPFDLAERATRRLLPGWLRRFLVRPLGRLYPQADWLPRCLRAKVTLRNIADDPAAAYTRSVGFLDDGQKQAYFTPDLAKTLRGYRSDELIRQYMNAAPRGDLAQLLYTDIKTYLAEDILAKVDRASMAVGLEVRVPLLNHTFVEFAHAIPATMKLEGGLGKSVFKSALRELLDDETLYRPKQGFTPPLEEWFRGPLREMTADTLFASRPAYTDFLERRLIQKAWDAHQARWRNFTPLLYAVLMFELWAARFLTGEAVSPPSVT